MVPYQTTIRMMPILQNIKLAKIIREMMKRGIEYNFIVDATNATMYKHNVFELMELWCENGNSKERRVIIEDIKRLL